MFTMPWFRLTLMVLAAALLFVGCDRADPQALVASGASTIIKIIARRRSIIRPFCRKNREHRGALVAGRDLRRSRMAPPLRRRNSVDARANDAAVPLLAQALWLQNQFDAILALPGWGSDLPPPRRPGAFRALANRAEYAGRNALSWHLPLPAARRRGMRAFRRGARQRLKVHAITRWRWQTTHQR